MKKHSRGYRHGGFFGGAVWEAKRLLLLHAIYSSGDKTQNLDKVFKDYIRRNFYIFRNAWNKQRLKRFTYFRPIPV